MKNKFKDLFDKHKFQSNSDPDYGPYESKDKVLSYIPKRMRRIGRTVGIVENGSVVEYWFKSGVEDTDMVPKIPIKQRIPKDFFIATSVLGKVLTYKTDDYREFDLSELLGIPLNNSNEIIRVGDNFYITINFTFDQSKTQDIVKLENCYLEDNIFKVSSFIRKSTGLKGVHSLVFNPSDNFIYAGERIYGTTVAGKIVKINSSNLNIIKTSNFPANATFGNSTTDIRIFNNKLYILVGINEGLKLYEVSTNLQDYYEVYSGGTDPALRHMSAQPFLIYNGKAYLSGYNDYTAADRTKHIILVEVDLITKSKRISGKIPINNPTTAIVGTHWMGVYNDKLLISTYSYGNPNYYSSIGRYDIKTFTKEEEKIFDFPITDDNSFIDGYLFLNGESFLGVTWISSYPNYPTNNAKLIKINPLDFTESYVEKSHYLNGYGSYGSVNQVVENGSIQLSDIRAALATKVNV